MLLHNFNFFKTGVFFFFFLFISVVNGKLHAEVFIQSSSENCV